MEQKVDAKKKIMKVVIWVVVIMTLMGTAHILANDFNIVEIFRVMHGG